MRNRQEDEPMSGMHKMGESAMQGARISASELTMYLKGINFPADKNKIVSTAKSNGAPENVMQYLNKLPDKNYQYSTEIEQEFSKMM